MMQARRKFVGWTALLVIGGRLSECEPREKCQRTRAGRHGQANRFQHRVFQPRTGETIVLLPFGGLTVGYLEGLSQNLADAGYRVVRINFRARGKVRVREKASLSTRWLMMLQACL